MSEPRATAVTRSGRARTAAEAGAVSRGRAAQPDGWWGMALFLCAEVALFGTLIGSYLYLDFNARRWPPAGIKPPSVTLPLIAAGVLVAMSAPMWLAARSARAGNRRQVLGLIAFATIVQGCYLALQILLFRHDYNMFKPTGSAYGSIYFTLLATHHAHVVFGLLLDLSVMAFVAIRGLNNYWLIGVRGLALYWHVVNAIAVAVVLIQLSPSL